MMFFAVSELFFFRASTPPTWDVRDRGTFRSRILQKIAIGAHTYFYKHYPQQLGVMVSCAQMGVVREVVGKIYVPLYVCHTSTLYARDGQQQSLFTNLILICIERF